MEQLTFDRSDWSGQQATIQVNRDTLEWAQSGYQFKLEAVEESFSDDDIGMSMRVLKCTSPSWEHPLFSLTCFSGESSWLAVHGDLSREGEDPIVVAAQMICNLV